MAFALTKFQAYGVEATEPVFKRHVQLAILSLTGLNTDAVYDISNFSGTFWTAVVGTEPGLSALKFFQDVAIRAQSLIAAEGTELAKRGVVGDGVLALLSNASAGGNATETYVVTGLLTTDTILGVSQSIKGGNSLPLLGYNTQAAGSLKGVYSADPGTAAKIVVNILRNGAAPVAGQFGITYANLAPTITFASGDAPTSWDLVLRWVLQPAQEPLELYKP